MNTIQKHLATLVLLLTAVTAQGQTMHKLTVISTAGGNLSVGVDHLDERNQWKAIGKRDEEAKGLSCEVAEGDSVHISIYASATEGWTYTYMECEGKKIHEPDSDHRHDVSVTYIMPDHDATIYVYADFDPDTPNLPSLPNGCSWNAATGELFLSGFRPYANISGEDWGSTSLVSVANRMGIAYDDVKKVTVMGEIGRQQMSFHDGDRGRKFPNVEVIDLRHTYNYIYYYFGEHPNTFNVSFSGTPNLKKLILPSDIEKIDNIGIWKAIPLLEEFTIYAAVPPSFVYLDSVPASCVLYVPEPSIAAYKADEYWGKFTDILPIPNGEAEDITVLLPDDFTDGRYVGMSLTLFNANTGEQTKYIVDERPSYIFYNQTCDEQYTALLQTAQGVVVATTDTLTVSDQPLEMAFKNVKQLYDMRLTVQTPAPTDVTDQATIVWMDAMGNRLGTGNTLARQIEGTHLLYGISLPSELAAHYAIPPRTELVVGANTANTTLTLALPDTITLSGKVTDPDGKPISMATVTASLMMNGTVGKVFTATTDQLGRYELTALAGDLTLSASARGYVAARRAASVVGGSPTDIAPIQLAPLSGSTIHYDFTYTSATTADEEATTLPYYSDYANVTVSAYNETTGEALDSLMVAYPEVQLLSGAKAGDRIRLTASSLKDAFMPVEVTVTLNDEEEQADSITFALKELGGIKASFLMTDNAEVTASLYDADGLLCQQETFGEATMTLEGLKDGDYTLVMMGSDPLFNKMLSLDDYIAVGLADGTDYVSNKVTVTSGVIAEVTNDQIPTLNVDPYYYIDEWKTSFLPNLTEITSSCNVTLRAEIGFKERYKNRVSNVRLLVDYPSYKANFVEGTSMTGTKMVRATATDGHISIPVENDFLDEPVRFILTATDQGTLMTSAQVQFDIDGREVTQPLGIATCEVKNMTIVAPEEVYKLSFPVHGDASALSPVRVYAGNDILVGETQSLADGSWQLHVELPDFPNLATIPIYAVITDKQGRELRTETVKVTYDKDMIRPVHVYMYPSLVGAHATGGFDNDHLISDMENQRIDFDFEHPETINQQWCVVNPYANGLPILFEIEFNTTDSTKVHNVVLQYFTVKGEIGNIRAEYDGTTGHWMCNIILQDDAVCNVNVLQVAEEREVLLDADQQLLNTHWVEYYNEKKKIFEEEVNRLVSALGSEDSAEKRMQLMDELAELIGVDVTNTDTSSMSYTTLDEAFEEMEKILQQISATEEEFKDLETLYDLDMGDVGSITHTTGLDPQQLLNEGYTEIKTTDGYSIYQLIAEDRCVMVDFQNDICIEIKNEAAMQLAKARAFGGQEFITGCNAKLGEINFWISVVKLAIDTSKILADGVIKKVIPIIKTLGDAYTKYYNIYHAAGAPPITATQQKVLDTFSTNKKIMENIHEAASFLRKDGIDIGKATQFYQNLPAKTLLGKLMDGALKAFNGVSTFFSYTTVLNDLYEGYNRVETLMKIWESVPEPCEEDQANATSLKKDIEKFAEFQGRYYVGLAASDLCSLDFVKKGIKTLIPTSGSSMSAIIAGITESLIKMGANWMNDDTYKNKMKHYEGELRLLQCDEEYRKKQDKWWKARLRQERRTFPNLRVMLDPSGYVYEAVADNRVENAKATIYFKQTGEDEYGDLHDEVVKWNAAEFRQENPQMTDAEGKYAWDVPQGLWQVKIEKEGYETAYSDWLPVPPPQLDINIPLVRNTLPDVQTARAYEDGVEVTFNEYMRPQSLTTERLILSQNGEQVPCRIEQQDRSQSYDKKAVYASRVKVRAESPLANGSKVQLTVRRQVEAYNGLQMQKDYQQEFTVVREVYSIGTDSIVEVAKGEERTITVRAFPAEAAQGMKVTAKSLIGTIATVTGEATFDANGEAHLTVTGKVGGQTALLLTLENSKVTAQSVIMVEDPSLLPVYAPTASHISGTYLPAGERVTLSCDTKDAVIWYTTDGTCPCDENSTRKKYTAPITVTEAVSIRAYAVKGDNVSRVVTFNYGIYDPVGIKSVIADKDAPDTYFSPNGIQLRSPQKGVNIIRKKGGIIEKVLMK